MQDKEREYFLEKIEEIKENKNDYSNGYLVEELFPESERIKEEIIGSSRWSNTKIQIYKFKEMYLQVCWEEPATEMQEGQDTNLEIEEVKPVKKEIIDYISMESEEN